MTRGTGKEIEMKKGLQKQILPPKSLIFVVNMGKTEWKRECHLRHKWGVIIAFIFEQKIKLCYQFAWIHINPEIRKKIVKKILSRKVPLPPSCCGRSQCFSGRCLCHEQHLSGESDSPRDRIPAVVFHQDLLAHFVIENRRVVDLEKKVFFLIIIKKGEILARKT